VINQLFNKLASDNGKIFKVDLLSQHKDNEILKEVCRLALDPTVNFYIRKIPNYFPRTANGTAASLGWALSQLSLLSNRAVTGNAAIDFLTDILSSLDEDDAKVIERVIQRDLRCGMSESTVNKVWPGLIPEYPYMRCCLPKHTKLDKFDWKAGVFSELKADGMFVNINVFPDKTVELTSRAGSVFPMDKFENVSNEVSATIRPNTQTHGEVLVKRNGKVLPREIGNGILNSVLKGGDFAQGDFPSLLVWDQIPLDQVVSGNKYKVPYKDRFDDLCHQLEQIDIIPTRIVYSMEEALEHYTEMLALGYEGTIIKDPNAIWEDTTSKFQVKFKLEVDVDLEIIDFTPGKGKNASTFGSITCASKDRGLVVNVSGFKDKPQKGLLTRQQIYDMRDKLMNTIMTVRGNGIMVPTKSNPVYSIFLPRFVEFRIDKMVADTTQQVIDQFDNAVKSK
jgi:DNA ligase-1